MNAIFERLPRELRRHGLTVRKVEGWRSRSAGGGGFDPRGIMFHHTATPAGSGNAPALGIVAYGRGGPSPVPGPLSQFVVGRDGTIYLVAAGRANHAGTGGPERWIPTDSGNTYSIGIECENSGVGEPWPEKQRRAIGILCAVLLVRMDKGAWWLVGHKEYTSRKIDPGGIDMDRFRRRVRRYVRKIRAGETLRD